MYNGTTVYTNTNDPFYYFSYPRATYNYDNYGSSWRPKTKKERRLKALLDQLDNNKSQVVRRMQREERERKAILDAGSRAKKQDVSTTRDPQRRMQTYEAAVAARQLRR